MDILDRSHTNRQGQKRRLLAESLAHEIWNLRLSGQPREAEFCLQYYDSKSAILDLGQVAPKTHRDVLEVVHLLKDGLYQKLETLAKNVISTTPRPACLNVTSNEAATYALRFAASLWLFIDASDWSTGETLDAFAKRIVPAHVPQKGPNHEPLHLNARSLVQIAGFEIVWTSNIADHLRLDLVDPKTPQLFCFRHACLLRNVEPTSASAAFPDRFLCETAETLALLFPFAESPQRRWDRRVRKKADLDVEAGIACNTPHNLSHYHYYQERLALIKQTYDRSQPDSVTQWLYDKRNSDKFYTFWFAVVAIILTLFFGLVQSITGVLQVLKS